MELRESLQQLEQKEALLNKKVQRLSDEQKRVFYREQSELLKDPDTYAALNWLFLGGIHHCYLGKYRLFAIEITLLIIAIIGFIVANPYAIYLLLLLALYEMPYLFFSQKIARQHNHEISCCIYDEITVTTSALQ